MRSPWMAFGLVLVVSGGCAPDLDGDHFNASEDCDDTNGSIHPDAAEVCDGLDQDCDGVPDDGLPTLDHRPDRDADGYGDAASEPVPDCRASLQGHVLDGRDCDDSDPTSHPGAIEVPGDGIDQDCDGLDHVTCRLDEDGDGHGGPEVVDGPGDCEGAGVALDGTDCDDADPDVHPDAEDLPDDDIDQDCSGADAVTCYVDLDLDGYAGDTTVVEPSGTCSREGLARIETDCDDADPEEHPGQYWYMDGDGDGYGDPRAGLVNCLRPEGHLVDHQDCDDADPNVNPAAAEICNEIDDDCSGESDDGNDEDGDGVHDVCDCDDLDPDEFPGQSWHEDSDGDGFGTMQVTQVACEQPIGLLVDGTDCDDADPNQFPGQVWYADTDGDGFGDAASNATQCLEPVGWVTDMTDCDDTDDDQFPGQNWHKDADGDGLGNPTSTQVSCLAPPGLVLIAGDWDCDDGDAGVGGPTPWQPDVDADGYGNDSRSLLACLAPSTWISDARDCDDSDPAINPEAVEVCDSVDNDCDGSTLPVGCPLTVLLGSTGSAALTWAMEVAATRGDNWYDTDPGAVQFSTEIETWASAQVSGGCPLYSEVSYENVWSGSYFTQSTWTGGCTGTTGLVASGSLEIYSDGTLGGTAWSPIITGADVTAGGAVTGPFTLDWNGQGSQPPTTTADLSGSTSYSWSGWKDGGSDDESWLFDIEITAVPLPTTPLLDRLLEEGTTILSFSGGKSLPSPWAPFGTPAPTRFNLGSATAHATTTPWVATFNPQWVTDVWIVDPSGAMVIDPGCATEPTSGSVTVTGSASYGGAVLFTAGLQFDGAIDCDGCADVTLDGAVIGTWCDILLDW